jgi:hypothetical protein
VTRYVHTQNATMPSSCTAKSFSSRPSALPLHASKRSLTSWPACRSVTSSTPVDSVEMAQAQATA